MTAVDQSAGESVEVLIDRAAHFVARHALEMLGGGYGRRVHIIAGPGNNGADGRQAGKKLQRRGVKVSISTPNEALPSSLWHQVDLIIDATFGTGFRGDFTAPIQPAPNNQLGTQAPVLAVDIPSGVDGLTGESAPGSLRATRTVTFAALKPGLLYGDGAQLAGAIHLVDIGLDVSPTRTSRDPAQPLTWHMERSDLVDVVNPRPHTTHKWRGAVWVIGGSPGMGGAPSLAANAAARSGAGYVRVSTPGVHASDVAPFGGGELVRTTMSHARWADTVISDAPRFHALVIGPGLGRSPSHHDELAQVLQHVSTPIVLDGDGLGAWEHHRAQLSELCRARFDRGWCTVLSPHDGEFQALSGHIPTQNRIASSRELAGSTGAIVVLKGHTTTIACPTGTTYVSTTGDQRLATAGTGDVLTGIIAAQLSKHNNDSLSGDDRGLIVARSVEAHGAAALLCPSFGFIASDLVDALPRLDNAIF